MASKRAVLEQIPTEFEERVPSTTIADRIGDEDTNVRDTIQALREEGFPIGGGQGITGYWLIQDDEELDLVVENIDSNIETLRERKQQILEAVETPPVSYDEPEDPPEPDLPQGLRDAVDALVDDRGIDGAERELKRRVRQHDDQDRALAGLSYLRTHYRLGTGLEVRPPA